MGDKKAYTPRWQDHPGYKTVVDQKSQLGILPSQQESKTDSGQSSLETAWSVAPGQAREKERALPLPSNHSKQREKTVGPTVYNKPRQVPYRTKSVPGEQYGNPTKFDYGTPTRRDGVTGTEIVAVNPLPSKRQKNLPSSEARKLRLDYLRNPNKRLKQKQKYKTKLKFDPNAKKYRKYYNQYKERFKRKGISPFGTAAERTKAWREDQKTEGRRKGLTPKEQAKDRKENPEKPRSQRPSSPGSTSRTYSLTAAWETLGGNWPSNWNTTTKTTVPPDQLEQNFGKGQSRDTGTPRKDPSTQEGASLRAPNLDSKPQPGLRTENKPSSSGMPSVQVNNPTSGSGKVIPLSYYTDIVNNTQQVPDGRSDRYLRNTNFEVKQAATMKDIMAQIDNDISLRAQDRPPQLVRIDTKNWMWHWASGEWRVKVQAFKRGNATNLRQLNLRISCNCPFWRWQGPEHWAKKGDYLLGSPVGSAISPKVRDPDHVHPVCKHVYAVLEKSKQFFVRPEKAPLRKLGSQFSVNTLDAIDIEVGTEPSAVRVARSHLECQLHKRVANRYLARKGV